MNVEINDRLNQLPDKVRDHTLGDQASDAILRVWKEYLGGDRDKLDKLKDIVGMALLKDIKIEQISVVLREMFAFDDNMAAEASVLLLREMFHPIKEYFPGTDEEIVRLGGEVPVEVARDKATQQFTSREEEIEDMLDQQAKEEEEMSQQEIVYGNIEDLIRQFPDVGTMVIGTQNAISLKGMPDMKPMIKYWIQDYKDKVMVYADHSNMDRVQYVCHDKNTRNMNDEERRQLNLIAKSVDGETELPYSRKLKKIDFSLIQDE